MWLLTWQEYAEWVLDVLGAEPQLQNSANDYADKPAYRPLTKFENRGLNLGMVFGIWCLSEHSCLTMA